MLESLLLVTFSGVLLASRRKIGFANPFQIYFLIWFFVFLGYYTSRNTYVKFDSGFLMLLLAAKSLSLLFLVILPKTNASFNIAERSSFTSLENGPLLLFAQVSVCVAMPFAYLKAVSLAGGADIFEVTGYIQLRTALTQDRETFGFLSYFSTLSFVVSSISVVLCISKKLSRSWLGISLATSLFYLYLNTGRTFILLSLLMIFVPLVFWGIVRLRGILIFVVLLICLFTFIASMTAKGVSADDSLAENIESFIENLRAYTVAPLLALSQLIGANFPIEYGQNTFRTFVAAAYTLKLTDMAPMDLIRDYAYVPDPTNVYTVYEVYLKDFYYFGIFIPTLFLLFHWALYRRAVRFGGGWVFYYSASVYPLMMQFFQDQYFSLFSSWVQIGFWYWLLLGRKRRSAEIKVEYA